MRKIAQITDQSNQSSDAAPEKTESNVVHLQFIADHASDAGNDMTSAVSPHAKNLLNASQTRVVKEGATGARALTVRGGDILRANPFDIMIKEGFNPRDFTLPQTIEKLHELAQSIAQIGVQKPLTVKYDTKLRKFVLLDGERRLRATMLAINVYGAGIESVPAILVDQHSSEIDLALIPLTHNMGENLNDLERAEQMWKIKQFGWSIEQIAKSVGLQVQRVNQILELRAAMTPELTSLYQTGQFAAGFIHQTLKKHDFDAAATLSNLVEAKVVAETDAVAKGNHVDETGAAKVIRVTEKHAKKARGEKVGRTGPKPKAAVVEEPDAEPVGIEVVAPAPKAATVSTKDFKKLQRDFDALQEKMAVTSTILHNAAFNGKEITLKTVNAAKMLKEIYGIG